MIETTPSTTYYRYRSAQSLGRLINEVRGSIWLARGSTLNDPFDGTALHKPAQEGPRNRKVRYPVPGAEHVDLDVTVESAACAACFFPDFQNVQMWSQYADNFTGLAIGYHSTKLQEAVTKAKEDYLLATELRFAPVDYRPHGGDALSETEKLFVKGPVWKHEREWRIGGELELSAFDDYKGRQLPCGEALSHVILGARMTPPDKRAVMWGLATLASRRSADLEPIQVETVRFDYEESRLVFDPFLQREFEEVAESLRAARSRLQQLNGGDDVDFWF